VERLAALARRPVPGRVEVDADAHHRLARELATECAVLLRNENGVLPLAEGAHVAVIGAFAEHPRFQGGGSAHVNATRVDVPLEEIRAVASAAGGTVAYAPGFTVDGGTDDALVEEAVAAARRADVAVVFAGLSEQRESEGFDRDTLDLPAEQVELIRRVTEAAARTVVVLANGGIVSLEGWHDEVDAILEGFVLGQGGGRAIADLLFGRANPSGHLAESIPLRIEDHPSWLNFPGEQGHVRYGEGVLVGYRHFATAQAPVRYPFGHGLSYTTFSLGTPVVEPSFTAGAGGALVVEVPVTNTGDRPGSEVVQLYVAPPDRSAVPRPVQELKAFAKVHLAPGETAVARLALDDRAFAWWDVGTEGHAAVVARLPLSAPDAGAEVRHPGWRVEPGTHTLRIGRSSEEIAHAVPLVVEVP